MLDITRPLLFEVAWEVANKVGGIYTVIKSKTPVTCTEYGDRYCLLGPLSHKTADMEVEETEPPTPALQSSIAQVRNAGFHCLFGKWLIPGGPFVLLFDVPSAFWKMNEWKSDLWNISAVPSPENDHETNQAIVFGYLVTMFLGLFLEAQQTLESRTQAALNELTEPLGIPAIIAHFHEWQAGVALILIRKRNLSVATIFTTHATLLGRYLCAGDVDFYNNLKFFDVDAEAGKRGIYHRYCIERAAAHCADVFTTVSKITAYEAEWLLKRQPDGILPNGLNVIRFQAIHEFQNLHAQSKEAIHEFVRGHFFGHYHFDLDNTVYFFTAGRYEYRNKGVDMFIESLARLNHRLKASNSNINVVCFIIMPAKNRSYTAEALRGQAQMKQLRQTVNQIQSKIGARIFEAATKAETPNPDDLISEEEIILLKGRILASKSPNLPAIVTHNMEDEHNDSILNALRSTRLFNNKDDPVKVIFHPEFLNSNSPLMSIDYEDFLRGCHMGVFPSYYEPWGYTPAECTVMGVPSITTNLSGFGCYMSEVISKPDDYGIYIVDRREKSVEDSLNQLTDYMFDFCKKNRRQRINQRNRCERLSDILDWKRLGLEYVKARWVAVKRKFPEVVAKYDDVHFDDAEDELSADFHSGYESDPNPFAAEDLDALDIRKKVPRPLSVPGSPIENSPEKKEGLVDKGLTHDFDLSSKEELNVGALMNELQSLGIQSSITK